MRAFDLRRGEEVRALPHPGPVLALALSSSAGRLLSAGADGSVRAWRLDWEPTPAPPPLPAPPTSRHGVETVRTRATMPALTVAPVAPPTTLREDLRRAAPIAVPALPAPPGRRGSSPGAGSASASASWPRSSRPGSRYVGPPPLSECRPTPGRPFPREFDLIDLAPFRENCAPGDYERHLAQMRSGNPDARDVACLAARGTAGVVADVLDAAPLSSPDALTARRLRRNAASALAGLPRDTVEALCARLADEREDARRVVSMALGVMDDDAATTCVREALSGGSPSAQAAAAAALRQRVARGHFPVDEAWALTRALLASPDPGVRIAGLLAAPVFTGDSVEPAVLPLLSDPDPDVAASATEALSTIRHVRKVDTAREGSS